jgi:hypothetical protein
VSDTEPIVITKRDGSVERFSLAKLGNCLATVMRDQAYDPQLAAPLARAVALHLREWRDAQPLTTDYVYRCVQSVLQQTGLGDVADDLAAHRCVRSRRRQRIRVSDAASSGGVGEPWCKAKLAETLESCYGLRHAVARFLAGRIEQQVFALNYRVISRPLLAELTRSEVLAWGLADEQVLRAGAAACQRPVVGRRPGKERR